MTIVAEAAGSVFAGHKEIILKCDGSANETHGYWKREAVGSVAPRGERQEE
jgi:hypothetical protein